MSTVPAGSWAARRRMTCSSATWRSARRPPWSSPTISGRPRRNTRRRSKEGYGTATWVVDHGGEHGLDASNMAIAGDSVGGNTTIAVTLMAKERGGPSFAAHLLYYPVTDAGQDTGSYHQFAEGYFLARAGMAWFLDQYLPGAARRDEILASPLRASLDELSELPPALVITGEADVLRDEGEAYASKDRAAVVPVTAVRYEGIIHDFVMLHPLAQTNAARAATAPGRNVPPLSAPRRLTRPRRTRPYRPTREHAALNQPTLSHARPSAGTGSRSPSRPARATNRHVATVPEARNGDPTGTRSPLTTAVGSAVLAPRELAAQGENLIDRGGDQGTLTVGPLGLQVLHVCAVAGEAT
jgi:hypothetical protein